MRAKLDHAIASSMSGKTAVREAAHLRKWLESNPIEGETVETLEPKMRKVWGKVRRLHMSQQNKKARKAQVTEAVTAMQVVLNSPLPRPAWPPSHPPLSVLPPLLAVRWRRRRPRLSDLTNTQLRA